jgi:hypothetical protein
VLTTLLVVMAIRFMICHPEQKRGICSLPRDENQRTRNDSIGGVGVEGPKTTWPTPDHFDRTKAIQECVAHERLVTTQRYTQLSVSA